MEIQKPEYLNIVGLKQGDTISYGSFGVYYDLMVTGIDDDRKLPVVTVRARNMKDQGYTIVDKVNSAGVVGILLGTTDYLAESVVEGVIVMGEPVALEIQIDGQIETSLLPAPETPPIKR